MVTPSVSFGTPTRLRRRVDHGRGTRHLLTVLSADEDELVKAAGGLIFDRVSGGWEVKVLLGVCNRPRPLHILGVDAQILGPTPIRYLVGRRSDSVVASRALYMNHGNVQRYVNTTSLRLTQVALWGGATELDEADESRLVEHRLSRAALAFKKYAIYACGGGDGAATGDTESFRSLLASDKRRSESASY